MPVLGLASYRRQNLLNEFASLRYTQLQGVYVSLTQGDPTIWNGVLFVRKGPYSPAVLRFKVSFGSGFPLSPPLITFAADAFHPLLTPLTTITYTTGLAEREPSYASDRERLPPGAFSLQHGFPQWYDKITPIKSSTKLEDERQGIGKMTSEAAASNGDFSSGPVDTRVEDIHVVDVLRYMRRCFEDEELLDSVPFEAAVNPGAWYGWRAHREKGQTPQKPRALSGVGSSGAGDSTPRKQNIAASNTPSSVRIQGTPTRARRPEEWNWGGVWEERVKKAVQASLSEPVLFGAGATREDEIRFQKGMDEAELEGVYASMRQHLQDFQ